METSAHENIEPRSTIRLLLLWMHEFMVNPYSGAFNKTGEGTVMEMRTRRWEGRKAYIGVCKVYLLHNLPICP